MTLTFVLEMSKSLTHLVIVFLIRSLISSSMLFAFNLIEPFSQQFLQVRKQFLLSGQRGLASMSTVLQLQIFCPAKNLEE
ncbi:hypothetical protein OROMI_024143 [Orobanche minor]